MGQLQFDGSTHRDSKNSVRKGDDDELDGGHSHHRGTRCQFSRKDINLNLRAEQSATTGTEIYTRVTRRNDACQAGHHATRSDDNLDLRSMESASSVNGLAKRSV